MNAAARILMEVLFVNTPSDASTDNRPAMFPSRSATWSSGTQVNVESAAFRALWLARNVRERA